MVYMKRVLFSVKPSKIEILDQMDKLRGNIPRSAFIIQSIQFMIDSHKKYRNSLSPLDLPTIADTWQIWRLYFKDQKLGRLVDDIRKLDQLISLAKREVESK